MSSIRGSVPKISEIDFLIKTTISKYIDAGQQVELSKISNLLDVHISSLILKMEKWIAEGFIRGTIDKTSGIFYPLAEGTEAPNIDQNNAQSIPKGPVPIKQTGFIKTETKETSQDDLIRLHVDLGYVGSNIRVGIKAINASEHAVSEVHAKILYQNVKLFKIKPKYEFTQMESGISVQLPDIRGSQQIGLNIFFKPESLGIGEIKGQFSFVNNKDFVRFIRIEKLFYDLTPPNITPKKIDPEQIENYTKQEGIRQDIRSYGLPDKLNPLGAFNHIIQIIRQYNFDLITKIEQPNQMVAWFFGETNEQKSDILIVGQIINKKIEFYASSFNEQTISSLPNIIFNRSKKRIINSRVVDDENDIFDLYCKECGGVLPFFPNSGETVKCKYCETENLIR